ncbi:CBS domain-containing protein [Streptomyces gelaticus]
MTLVQMQPHPANAGPVPRTALDDMNTAGPQVCDDMTVEVALSVMASDRTGHLRVCDNDGLCTGLVTRAHLTTVRDSPAYTDRLQLRDILGDRGPHTSPATMMAEHVAHHRRLAAQSVVDEQASAPGVLALALAL